jgi:hypothetical protein
MFVTSRINLMPHRAGLSNISPSEAFRGRKIDFKRDLRLGFGEYCEVFDPRADNSMRSRTQAAISLMPSGNVSGSVKFLSLASGKTIVRDQFTQLPCTDIVINQMNVLAVHDLNIFKSHKGAFAPLDVEDDLTSEDQVFLEDDSHPDPTIVVSPIAYPDDMSLETPDEPFIILPQPEYTDFGAQVPLRGDLSLNNEIEAPLDFDSTPTFGFPVNIPQLEVPTESVPSLGHRYNTRSSSKGQERVLWDPKVVGKGSKHRAMAIESKIFNISVKKAIKTMPKEAIKSMYKELAQLHDKNVFQGLKPSFKHQKKVIKSFMFLKEKFTSTGAFDKLKSRLVAGGHMQDRSDILYEDINSPTAALSHLMIIAAIAARDKRKIKSIDIGGAYLNADMTYHDILMELDSVMSSILCEIDSSYKKFLREDGTMVVKLRKALYGCIESAKLWYNLLTATLLEDGFIQNPLDPCIFNKLVRGEQLTVVIYVDDLFITCKNGEAIEELESLLRFKFKEITVHEGLVHSYLGMTWDYSQPSSVKVTMEGYTNDLLRQANISGIVKTPATDNLFAIRDAPLLDIKSKSIFHTLTAKLLYLAKRTRPDILLSVSFLTTRVTKPDQDDQAKLERVIKYLNGTSNLGIILSADSPARIKAYVDASYGVHDDGKSHTGLMVSIGAGPISIKSSKQKIVTKSSTEAELISASDEASEALGNRDFLIAQGELDEPAILYQDNMSTIAMINNGSSKSSRTRHINIRHFWMKERVDMGELSIVYLPTDDMIADILTKPLQGEKFLKLRELLLNLVV